MRENLSKQLANVATAIGLNESEREQLRSFTRSSGRDHENLDS